MADALLFENADRDLLEDGLGVTLLDVLPTFDATLGSVTDTGSISPPTGWASGRSLTVHIPEIASGNDASVNIALRNMTGTAGLILFHAGSNNPAWWDDGTVTAQGTFMTELANRGYRIVQIQGGTNYWMNAPSGSDLGSAVVAKRPATLIKYIHDTYSDTLPFIVVGSSAGSSAAAYSLVFMGLSTIIDRVVHCASVPHADVWRSCAKAFKDEAFWGASAESSNLIDIAHGYAGDNTGPCYIGNASTEGALWGATNLVGRAITSYQWSSTQVDELIGDFDPFKPQGMLYHQQLKDASQPHRLGIIPQGVHVILDTDKGRQTITAAIDQKPYLGAWGEASSASASSLTATLAEAPATGQLIVAIRKWRGANSVGTVGTGWTRQVTQSTSGGSPFTVAIETRVSDGTEGTSLAFATTSAVESAVTACVVLRTDTRPVTIGSSTTSGTGTSASFSTGSVNPDAVTFAAVVVEDTGANTMNEAWTNDHDQFGGALENYSTAYAIHATAGTKTTGETWVESVPYAGTMLTLSPVVHTGTLATTLDDSTLAASGAEVFTGTLATTLDDTTLAASGSGGTSSNVDGTLATTLDDAVLAANGSEVFTGTLTTTLDDSTLAATGSEVFTGALATTLDDATLAASGGEVFTGTLATTLDDSTLAASGSEVLTGTLATTLDDATLSGAGGETFTGTLAATLDDTALTGAGTVANPVTGTLTVTLDDATLASSGTTGTAPITGTLAATLDDTALVATGALIVTGTLGTTLEDIALTAAAFVGAATPTPTVRTKAVLAESRSTIVAAESRVRTIPAETRTLEVPT